ncbi:ABC transporter [Bhargavaea ginsengi]|uniref:ABC transporter permease n=1 Tax=Bhargavaea ginsengi TaxID=426757 RepID=UPI00203BEA70|nr:ABC transporter [Bhargavaea ginsengi]MCM3086956.1 ABC transporter [Bhargavaea ginsengi]
MRHYFRLSVKDTRFRIFWWIFGIASLTLMMPPAFHELYPTQADRDVLKATMENPAVIAMTGPIQEGDYTLGVMFSHEMAVFMAIVVGLFNIMIVNSLSRRKEDDGLLEVVLSKNITRNRVFAAQVLVGILMNAILALVLFAGLQSFGYESMETTGNFLYAAQTFGFGLFFYGLTLLVAQLLPSADWTFGIVLAVLLIGYAYRAATDVAAPDLSVVSPYNWISRLSLYSENEAIWLVPFVLGPVFLLAAWLLFRNRDLGGSVIRLQVNRRSRNIGSHLRLAFTLSRTLIISWFAGMLLIGASYGSILGDLESFIGDNEMLRQMAGEGDGTLAVQFIGTLMVIVTLIGLVPPLMVMGKLLKEERRSHLEYLGTLNISRMKLMGDYITLALAAGFLSLFLANTGMYAASLGVEDISLTFVDYMVSSLNYFPAVLLFTGLSAFLIGLHHRLHVLVWLYLLYNFFVSYLGQLLGLDDSYRILTPFHYLNETPSEAVDWGACLAVGGIGLLLMALGLILFRKRDLA